MGIFGRLLGRGAAERQISKPTHSTDPKEGFANIPDLAGSFLVWQFVSDKETRMFGQPERIEQLVAEYPPDLRAVVRLWCMYYLAWGFRLAFVQKYGSGASEDLVKAVHARMSLARLPEVDALRDKIVFWMKDLDKCAAESMNKINIGQHKDFKMPLAFFVALHFLVLDEDSPYYQRQDIDHELSYKLMITLSTLHDEFLDRVREYAQRPTF